MGAACRSGREAIRQFMPSLAGSAIGSLENGNAIATAPTSFRRCKRDCSSLQHAGFFEWPGLKAFGALSGRRSSTQISLENPHPGKTVRPVASMPGFRSSGKKAVG
jgi:hypothetical protein